MSAQITELLKSVDQRLHRVEQSGALSYATDGSAEFPGGVTVGTGGEETLINSVVVLPPTNLVLATGTIFSDTFIDASWTAPIDPDFQVVLYEIILTEQGEGTSQRRIIAGTSTRFEALKANTAYDVTVRSIDRLGRTSTSITDTISTNSDATVPSQIVGLQVSAGIRSILAKWTESTEVDVKNGEGLYEVQLAEDAAFSVGLVTVKSGSTIVGFTDLATSTTYYVRVRAIDRSGNSGAWSATGNATTPQVVSGDLADGSVLSAKLADLSVTLAKLAANSVDNTKIIDGAVGELELAANAVTEAKIAVAAVTASKLNVAIGGGNLLRNSSFESGFTGSAADGWFRGGTGANLATDEVRYGSQSLKISASAYNYAKQALVLPPGTYTFSWWQKTDSLVSSGAGVAVEGSGFTTQGVQRVANPGTTPWTRKSIKVIVTADPATVNFLVVNQYGGSGSSGIIWFDGIQVELGDVATAYAPKPDEILPGTITTTEIADDSITTPKIVAGAVVTGKIAAGAVTANEIAANTITAGQIAAATITSTQIAAGTIVASNIAAGTITGDKLVANTLTALQIASGAITTDELAANAVIASKIAANTITANEIAADTITANQIAANAITASELAANSVTAAKIVAGTIVTSHIDAVGLDAATIKFGTMSGDRITANTLDVNKLTSSTLTSKTITIGTGGVFKVNGAAGSVLIDSNGVSLYNAPDGGGTRTVHLNAADGNASFTGTITSGSTITGASISGGTIDIGGFDSTSFHVDATGQMWVGAATYASAPFKVSATGGLSAAGAGLSGNLSVSGQMLLTGRLETTDVTNWCGIIPSNFYSNTKAFFAGRVFYGQWEISRAPNDALAIRWTNIGGNPADYNVYIIGAGLRVDANLDAVGQSLAKAGTSGSPGFGFRDQANTGFYRNTTSSIAVTLNGQPSVVFSQSNFRPSTGDPTLGEPATRWREGWFGESVFIGSAYLTQYQSNSVKFSHASADLCYILLDRTGTRDITFLEANDDVGSASIYSKTHSGQSGIQIDSTGNIRRSSSSIKFKKDVETLDMQYAENVLNLRPVWFRPRGEQEIPDKDDWGFYGLIAEEVAEVDPRLAVWGVDYEKEPHPGIAENAPHRMRPKRDKNGRPIPKRDKDGKAIMSPEDVQYDKIVPALLMLVKDLRDRVEELESVA